MMKPMGLVYLSFIFYFIFFLSSPSSSSSSSVTISITPEVLPKTGDPVRVSWTGVDSPSNLDWLGIYSPPDSAHNNFIGYVFLSSCPTWRSGSGSVQIPLVNLRSDHQFRIFRWTEDQIDHKHHDHDNNPLPGTKHLLAESGRLRFKAGLGPEQIHLSYTDRDDELRVMFISVSGEEASVRYGLGVGDDQMTQVAPTQVGTYRREHMCDSPANHSVGWRDPGYIHDGVMTNLKKGKRYYYKVGSEAMGWSVTHSFMSRDVDSDETIAFLFGDMGAATPYKTFIRTQDESKSTVRWILRDLDTLGNKPAFVSHIGDISYARGYSWLWDVFFTQIEPVASKVPYHVCIGNHEYDWPQQPWRPDWSVMSYGKDGGGECGVPYSLRFNMPGNSSEVTGTQAPATRNLFYSFDMGPTHFVYISTETNFLPGSHQYDFIKRDLESVDRKKTPFVVVQGHRPMYTTSYEYRDKPLRVRLLQHLEPLFVKNNVTLALWGHVHRYERFCPLSNYTCGSMGVNGYDHWERLPVHLVIGMAGQDWQPIWEPRPDHLTDPIFPQPMRSMYRGGEFGYIRIVASKVKLTLSYVGNHDGEVHDMVEILASGQVLNGGSSNSAPAATRGQPTEASFSWYVKGASVLVLGAFIGYVIGFISRARRECSGKEWTPVKNEEA